MQLQPLFTTDEAKAQKMILYSTDEYILDPRNKVASYQTITDLEVIQYTINLAKEDMIQNPQSAQTLSNTRISFYDDKGIYLFYINLYYEMKDFTQLCETIPQITNYITK